jgi:hypothetical protein
MRIQSFKSTAIFTLSLGLTGCRVQSVLVMPSLTPYSYAAPGQTLEWLPYNSQARLYVIFDGTPPCKKSYYKIGPEPARCTVLKGHNGYFSYHFDTVAPSEPPVDTILHARSCPYCQIAIRPGNSSSVVSPEVVKNNDREDKNRVVSSKVVKSYDGPTGYTLPVSCSGTPAVTTVDNTTVQNGVQDQDTISWVPSYPYKSLRVTTSNMCSGGNNGVFTVDDVCTVTGSPGTKSYTVHLDQCDGSSSLTINNPPPAR